MDGDRESIAFVRDSKSEAANADIAIKLDLLRCHV